MNDLTVFIYFTLFAMITGATFAFTFNMMKETMKEFNKPRRKVHPEMEDVQTGDELLIFNLEEDDDNDEENITVVRR